MELSTIISLIFSIISIICLSITIHILIQILKESFNEEKFKRKILYKNLMLSQKVIKNTCKELQIKDPTQNKGEIIVKISEDLDDYEYTDFRKYIISYVILELEMPYKQMKVLLKKFTKENTSKNLMLGILMEFFKVDINTAKMRLEQMEVIRKW